jgi:hypothetical protein
MIQQVVIKKDGFYVDVYEDGKEGQVKLDECLYVLRYAVVIDDGVTFGDIIRAVHSHPELEGFIGLYNNCNSVEHNDFILNVPAENKDTDIEWLEVSWTARVWTGSLDLWVDCFGMGKEGTAEDGEREHYAIDLTPANKLVDLPVKINTSLNLYFVGSGKVIGEDICTTKHGSHIKAERFISFLDLLDALYEEISFFGSNERKERVLEDLKEASEEMESKLENGEILPWSIDDENPDGMKIYLSDQVRDVLGLPDNETDRDQQIAESADSMLDEFTDTSIDWTDRE